MTYLKPYSIKTKMGFVKIRKPIQSDCFFRIQQRTNIFFCSSGHERNTLLTSLLPYLGKWNMNRNKCECISSASSAAKRTRPARRWPGFHLECLRLAVLELKGRAREEVLIFWIFTNLIFGFSHYFKSISILLIGSNDFLNNYFVTNTS